MNPKLKQHIIAKSEQLLEKVRGYREHLHAHPELSYEEFETMEYISTQLTKIGIFHEKGVATTGIVAIIRGDKHTKTQDCIALRADIDALPILEENDTPYISKNEGVMHACGHDVHTSVLLGTAEILYELRNDLESPIKLIFQPGEEKNPGGASLMIKAGSLENPKVSKMYGLHSDPDLTVGVVGTREGLFMASCDEIYITIIGKGGHGARPHEAIDSILIGAEIVTSLQQIVSRNSDPFIPCVLSFGHFEALGATNIIPEKVYIKGTFRTMNEGWRSKALKLIEKQAIAIAEGKGATMEMVISKGYPSLDNDIETTANFIKKAQSWLGEKNVVSNMSMRMGAEDFSFYAQKIPTCFFRLGVKKKESKRSYGLHTSRFDIDVNALKIGMQMMTMVCF